MNLQIQFPSTEGEPTLCVHANNGHDEIACGQRILDWTDPETGMRHQAVLTPVDKEIDCGRCLRIAEVASATETVHLAEAEQREAVQDARADGISWGTIAGALGTTRQSAHERFAKDETKEPNILTRTRTRTRTQQFEVNEDHDRPNRRRRVLQVGTLADNGKKVIGRGMLVDGRYALMTIVSKHKGEPRFKTVAGQDTDTGRHAIASATTLGEARELVLAELRAPADHVADANREPVEAS